MLKYFVLLVAASVLIQISVAQAVCPANEQYDPCDTPCPLRRCDVDPRLIRCAAPPNPGDKDCVVGCRCIDGYARDANGVCVPRKKCPRCTGPHEYYSCGGACDNVCDTIKEQNQTNCPIIKVKCNEMCYCEEGYARDYKGECIPIKDCPECPTNEKYDPCPETLCPPKTCDEAGFPTDCPPREDGASCPGKPGCVCRDGYLRDENGRCIESNECPSCGGDKNATLGCGVNCNRHCSNVNQAESQACILICYPNACDCRSDINGRDYYYDDNLKKCVLPEDCTPQCKQSEVFSECVNGGCGKQKCSDINKPVVCVHPKVCNSGCICAPGFLRAKNGTCVPSEKCDPPPKCKANEEFSKCGRDGCLKHYCSDLDIPPLCRDTFQCIPQCECKEGFLRASFDNDTCVPIEKCPTENLLVLEGMSDCIKQESSEARATEDRKAMAKLILTIDPSLYVHIKEAKSTKDLWQRVRNMFDDSGFSRRITLLRNLISIRLDSCESMTSYVTQIIETAQKLSGTGFSVNDEWIGSLLLAGLPEKYFPMIMAIEHSGIAITSDVVKTKLIDLAGNDCEAGSAFLSRGQHSRHSLKVGSTGKFDNSNQLHGGAYGGKGKSMPDSSNVKSDKSNVKCYRCKQFGHYKSQCKQQNNQPQIKKTNAFSAVFLSGDYSKQDFYLDSGASTHMTPNINMIQNASFTTSIKEIIAANQNAMPVLCSGDVDIMTVTPDSLYEVTLKDVLCVPNLTTNLISISQLIKNGNKVDFKENCCHVYNRQNTLVAVANLIDGVYKMVIEKKQCLFTSSSSAASSEVWHRRLGHLNMNDLNKMKEGAVTGISFTDNSVINKNSCTVCCEGKQSRSPFGHVGTRSSEPLEVIHADVCGPMEVTSIGGASNLKHLQRRRKQCHQNQQFQ